jgi:hypothetical protein
MEKEGAIIRPAYGPIDTLSEKSLQEVLVPILGVPMGFKCSSISQLSNSHIFTLSSSGD